MNSLDYILIAILAFALVRGFVRGLILEVAAVLGILAGFVVAGHYHPVLSHFLGSRFPSLPHAVFLGYALVFLATWLAVALLGLLASKLARALLLGWADRLLGAAVGLFKGTLAAAVLVTVLTLFLPGGSKILGHSLLAPYLQKAGSHLVRLAPAAVAGLYQEKQERQAGQRHEAQSAKTMKQ
jgi:membrane protein required for colicin V production